MSKIKKVFTGVVALVLLASFATSANAATYTWTRALKQGSVGTDVWNLQMFLNMCPGTQVAVTGAGAPGHETSTFGPATKAAVIRFQVANGLVADGIFGSMSAAKATALQATGNPCGTGTGSSTTLPAGCTSTSGFSTVTGQSCAGSTSTVPGCMPGYMYSSTTGAKCDGTSPSTGPLTGTAGDITVSSYSSGLETQVGEGMTNAKVLGFELEADAGSDVSINSLKVTFINSGSGSKRLDRYVDSVSIWNENGVKVGSASASDFTESSDLYSRSIALSNPVIKADQKMRFYIAVDAADNIDSADYSADNWTVKLDSTRFTDASGAILTDDTDVTRSFNFTSLASANDLELKVNLASDNPKAETVKASTTTNTNGIQVLKFTLKAQGGSMVVDKIPVRLTTSDGNVSDVTGNLTLNIDGQSFSESVSTSSSAIASVVFDDLNLDLSEDETVTGTISADINSFGSSYGNFAEGTTLKAEIISTYVTQTGDIYVDVEDENGDQLVTGDRSGSAIGELMTFRSIGVNTVMGTPSYSRATDTSGNYTSVTYTIPVSVTSFGNTLYVGQTAQLATTVSGSNAFALAFQTSAAATTDEVTSSAAIALSSSDATTESNGFRIDDGSTKHFTLTVTLNTPTSTNSNYRVQLKQIQTFTNGALYTGASSSSLLPVESYRTDYQFINS